MKKIVKLVSVIIFLFPLLLFGKEKIAQTGFQFLSVKSDARATAMGEAMTTVEGNSSSLFYNPATMAKTEGFFDITFSNNSWIADIKHTTISICIQPSAGNFGVFGLSLQSVNYGELQGTINWANSEGYYDTEIFEPSALALGVGYAKRLNDKLSIGTHIRSTHQYLGKCVTVIEKNDSLELNNENAGSIAFDFGTYLETGFKSLAFGMSVKNFSNDIKYEKESFQLPLNFTIGISMDLMDIIKPNSRNSLLMAIDATHPRSHDEQIKIGVDYSFLDILSLRGGYIIGNDENDISFGAGIRKFGIAVDYAVIPFGVFGNVSQFTVRFSL